MRLAHAAIATIALGLGLSLTGCGSGSGTAAIARKAAATSCTRTHYTLAKQQLYDCAMPNGSRKCLIEHGGLVLDETDAAHLLFGAVVGSQPPACAR